MKKIITVLTLVTLVGAEMRAIESTSGNLGTNLSGNDAAAMTSLTVEGTMDARDFLFINNSMPQLATLDISGVTIEAFSSKDALFGNTVSYAANELPQACFTGMKLQNISLPATVSAVSNYAFAGCNELKAIVLPQNIQSIGSCAFYGASALEKVETTAAVISDYAFGKCEGLTSIAMPQVREIGAYAFTGCNSLSAVNYPATLTAIGEGAFKGTSIAAADLSSCTSLAAVGAWAFADNAALATVKIPEGITSVGEGAFFYNTNLKEIALPQSITVINNYAFGGDNALTDQAVLPEGITSIGDYAFEGWEAMTQFIIPKSVEYIGKGAFKDWKALAILEAKPTTPPTLGEDVWENLEKSEIELRYPYESAAAYSSADQWRDFFMSSVEQTYSDNKVKYTVNDNILTLTAAAGIKEAAIFDISGIILANKKVAATSVNFNLAGFAGKVYIVRCVCADNSETFIKFGVR